MRSHGRAITTRHPAATAAAATHAAAGNATGSRSPLRLSGPWRASGGSSRPASSGLTIRAGRTSSAASATPDPASCQREAPRDRSSAASAWRWLLSITVASASVAPAITSRIAAPMASWDLVTTSAVPRPDSSPGSPVDTVWFCTLPTRATWFTADCSRPETACRSPAPILATSGTAAQAAASTATCPVAITAGVVTSGP